MPFKLPILKATFHGHNHDEIERYLFGGKPYIFDSHVSCWVTKKAIELLQ